MGARKKRAKSMGREQSIAQAISSFVSTSDGALRQYYPHRLGMTTVEVRETNGQARMVMGRHYTQLEFGPFNYFFIRWYLAEIMGEAFKEAVTYQEEYIPIENTPYAELESWYDLFVSTQPSYRQFAPIWEAPGCFESPFDLETRRLGYWKSPVSVEDAPSLEDRLRKKGFSAGFDPKAGMMYYSNMHSVALGLPPTHAQVGVWGFQLNSFGEHVSHTSILEKALKYASKQEVSSWPTVDERDFRLWRLKKMKLWQQHTPQRVAYLHARQEQGKADQLRLLALRNRL